MRTIYEIILEDCRAENPEMYHEKDMIYRREYLELAMKKYAGEVLQQAINKISMQPIVFPPEEGEPDYGPGKYMAIGMLYEFKEQMEK